MPSSRRADGFKLGTEAANGVVTLRFGPDFTPARRAKAAEAIKYVTGVTKVLAVHKA